MTKTRTLTAGVALVLLVLGAGCSQRYSAERDAKKAGQAICDLRNATSADQVSSARNELNKQLDDLGNKYAMFTADDRRQIQQNVADLAEHGIQGNTALRQQDVAAIQRNASQLAEQTDEVSRAAWEGLQEGLADCTS